MKKLKYTITFLLVCAGLSSCSKEIDNPTIKNLIGTWDLETLTWTTESGADTTIFTHKGLKDVSYIRITKDEYICPEESGGESHIPFRFTYPHLYLGTVNKYDLVFISTTKMVLKANVADISTGDGSILPLYTRTYKKRFL